MDIPCALRCLGPAGGPPPTPGDVIRLAIEADDNHQAANGAPRPNTGRTKEVRSYKDVPDGDVDADTSAADPQAAE